MQKYQFVVGVSLSALEEELNRLVNYEPSLKLIQVIFAVGTGFVAIVERSESDELPMHEPIGRQEKPKKPPQKTPREPGKKS